MDEKLDYAKIQFFVQLFGQKTWAKNCTTVSSRKQLQNDYNIENAKGRNAHEQY